MDQKNRKQTEFRKELNRINSLRKKAYTPTISMLLLLGAGLAFPIMSPIFGIIIFILFQKKLKEVAHYPCPRCKSSLLGDKQKIKIIFTIDRCSNCDLSLHSNLE